MIQGLSLPGCGAAHRRIDGLHKKKTPLSYQRGFRGKDPGDDLLSHRLGGTTIGAAAFHFRVRDGIGWFHSANFTRETVGASPAFRSDNEGLLPCYLSKKRIKALGLTFGLVT